MLETINAEELGFELLHVGINCENEEKATEVAGLFNSAFEFKLNNGNSSIFAGGGVEVMKTMGAGERGHLAIKTNNIEKAIMYLRGKGFEILEETKKYKDGKLFFVYLKENFGGFAVHLIEK